MKICKQYQIKQYQITIKVIIYYCCKVIAKVQVYDIEKKTSI